MKKKKEQDNVIPEICELLFLRHRNLYYFLLDSVNSYDQESHSPWQGSNY